jgi:outer membrane protein assembly factor BamB
VWSSTVVQRTLATASIADGLVYIPDNTGNLYCFDAGSGEQYWTHALGARTWCSSAFTADGKVYISSEANVMWVLKAGKEKQVLSRTLLNSMPITPVAADGVLYIPTQKSLIAIPGKPSAPQASAATGAKS